MLLNAIILRSLKLKTGPRTKRSRKWKKNEKKDENEEEKEEEDEKEGKMRKIKRKRKRRRKNKRKRRRRRRRRRGVLGYKSITAAENRRPGVVYEDYLRQCCKLIDGYLLLAGIRYGIGVGKRTKKKKTKAEMGNNKQ